MRKHLIILSIAIFALIISIDYASAQTNILRRKPDNPSYLQPNQVVSTNGNQPSHNSRVSSANAVSSFYFIYEFDDTGNKRRDWSRSGEIWTERYADGRTTRFRVVGQGSVDDCVGVIVQRSEDDFQVFIPDEGCEGMWLRHRSSTQEDWHYLAQMKDIR